MTHLEAAPTGCELQYDPEPTVWLVGPNEIRPPEIWIPGATEVVIEDFGASDQEQRAYIQAVISRFAEGAVDSPLTERLLRWRGIADTPFGVFLGMVGREAWSDEEIEGWVRSLDEPLVEPAMLEDVTSLTGATIRRGLAYSSHGDDQVVVAVRYVIDSGVDELFAVMHTATSVPARMIEALEDLDELAGTVRIHPLAA